MAEFFSGKNNVRVNGKEHRDEKSPGQLVHLIEKKESYFESEITVYAWSSIGTTVSY